MAQRTQKPRPPVDDATTDPVLALADDIGAFTADPLGYAHYAFAWGESELAGMAGPRVWQQAVMTEIREHLSDPARRFPDPIDSSASLGQASTLSLRTQLLTFQNGSSPGGCYDFALAQFHFEMNVPAGAIELNPSFNISFLAGAVTAVTVGLAEFAVVDQGAAEAGLPYLPMQNTAKPWMDITAATTLTTAQILACGYYRLNATAAAFAFTLPAASSCRGQTWTGKKIDSSANAVTITRAGSDTIDGATTAVLSAQYASLRLISNGAGWDVI